MNTRLLNPVRDFEDLKARVLEALRAQFPFVGTKHRLELESLEAVDSTSPDDEHHVDNVTAQQDTKLSGRSWEIPVRASLRLVNISDGKVLSRSSMALAKIPKLTRRYSYIIEGQERQHDSVFRLRSRPYHIIADNGDIKAKWNMAGGLSFDLDIDRASGAITMHLGSSNIPVYTILSALGVSDSQMVDAWGKEVFAANQKKARSGDIFKAWKVLKRPKQGESQPSVAEAAAYVRDYFLNKTKLRPDAMLAAFGREDAAVTGSNLLMSSKRVLGISRGTEEEDDRQSLASKDLASTGDFIVEAIQGRSKDVQARILSNLDRKTQVREVISPYEYTRVIRDTFTYAQRPEQHNPLDFISGHLRTTIRGADFGGITAEKANVDPDKRINPSHLGFLDVIQTPEGEDTGIALHLPLGVMRDGRELRTEVYDVRKGATRAVTPAEMSRMVVAFPDQVTWSGGKPSPRTPNVTVRDLEQRTTQLPWADVDAVLPSAKATLSFSANLIPFLQNDNGNRAMMAAKQQEQAVPLKHREAPLVQSKTDGALTFEELLGGVNAHLAPLAGTVTEITSSRIVIKTEDGKTLTVHLYDHFPLNGGKGMIHATPTVKVGDKVQRGQLLADTNFTKDGRLALGTNLRVAYLPYRGLNFEDGIVVSETAATKLTSEHLHSEVLQLFPGMVVSRSRWPDYAVPERATRERLSKLGEDGIVRVGERVVKGDILVAALAPQAGLSRDGEDLRAIRKSLVKDYRDRALTWNEDHPGVVARVVSTGNSITVFVRTDEPLAVGDKLAGRHGNKGIVSRILPDYAMPKDKNGAPVEVLLSPAGVPSRKNVGQILETAAGKLARLRGRPFITENFVPGKDYTQDVKDQLHAAGVSDTEELFDPESGRSLGQVMVGNQYVLKLHHMVDHKMTARSFGTGYSVHGQAPRGAGVPGGGQKMDQLGLYAMLAHGAEHNLREMYTFKSDGDQDDVWYALMAGQELPDPKPSKAMHNLVAYMKAMGIHTEKAGDKYVLSPMTDAQTKGISNGVIRFPSKTLHARGIRTLEEAGGLFDPGVTGARFTENGLEGEYWGHIPLQVRVPNPMFEGPICMLLGIKKAAFEKLVGPELVDGRSGFDIINEGLSKIDVPKELAESEARLGKLKGPQLDRMYRKVRYLRALRNLNITPLDAYTNAVLPVIPPAIRQVKVDPRGRLIFDDLNQIYRSVGQANDALRDGKRLGQGPEQMQQRASGLYDMVRALRLSGLDLGSGGKKRHHKGLMEKMKGGDVSPKTSYFQDQVMRRRQDLSARSTIVPEPNMGLDEVGIPQDMAFEMFKPFIVRELRQSFGVRGADAMRMHREKAPLALEVLGRVADRQPVLMKRDPALHAFSVMAFKPKIIGGKAIALHPLVTGGFNADFDGDAMALFVPVHDLAIAEARKMLPSAKVFSPTTGGLMPVPSQDSLLGLFQVTGWGTDRGKALSRADAVRLVKAGTLDPNEVITVAGKKTTGGRLMLADSLPAPMHEDEDLVYNKDFRLDKGRLRAFLSKVAKGYPNEFARTVDAWKDHGNRLSYLHGSSFSLNDFHDGKDDRDRVLAPFRQEEARIRAGSLPPKEKERAIVEIYARATKALEAAGKAAYGERKNRMYEWAVSGARGGWDDFAQLVIGPILVTGSDGAPVPLPITKSFGEGLSFSEYMASMHGARKGTLDRASGTSDPGALTKQIINTVVDMKITMDDCGTTEGVFIDCRNSDILDRYTAKPIQLKDGALPAETLVTPQVQSRLITDGVLRAVMRSPLRCKAPTGVCAKCFGLSEAGKHHAVGTNIGVIAGQALGEPVTQLTMRTFHTGGAIGTGGGSVVDAFRRVKDLLLLPKKLSGAAVLAKVDGAVTSIQRNQAQGGWDVQVGTTKHYLPANQPPLPTVVMGALVQKGEALSLGPKNPHELLRLTGNLGAVRGYLTDELDRAYNYDETGKKKPLTGRRNIETVVRATTNLTMIDNPNGQDGVLRGQYVPLAEIEHRNREAAAEGQPLIAHTPQLRGLNEMPLLAREDWLGRLNFQRLERTFQEGGAQGWASDIHGSTIAGIAHGAEVGVHKRAPSAVMPGKK